MGYAILTVVAIAAVIALELAWARTGVLRQSSFWIAMAIMWFFQIFVDGFLTNGDTPIVRYADDDFSGVRIFFDSPIEDFGFAFALVLLVVVLWDRSR